MKKIKAFVISFGVVVCACVILLALSSAIIEKMAVLPAETATLITTVIACVAVFLGGLISSAYSKERGVVLGLVTGVVFCICAALVSTLLFHNNFNTAGAAKFAAVLISGAIGGILGVNRKTRVKF